MSCCVVLSSMFNKMLILFMMQEQLPEDLLRVDLLFRKAHESGIIIQVNPCFCQMFLLAPLLKKVSRYCLFH